MVSGCVPWFNLVCPGGLSDSQAAQPSIGRGISVACLACTVLLEFTLAGRQSFQYGHQSVHSRFNVTWSLTQWTPNLVGILYMSKIRKEKKRKGFLGRNLELLVSQRRKMEKKRKP